MSDPLHPALVHVPLGLAFVLPWVTAGVAVAIDRGLLPRRAWVLVALLQLLVVAGGAAALLSGFREEHAVDGFVSSRLVQAHEERAVTFLLGAAMLLALTVSVLAVPARRLRAVAALAVAGSLIVAGLGLWTGRAGGELVYRHGAAAAYRVQSEHTTAEVRPPGN
ncbi:MAG: hypothetical protein HZB56_01925 [Deltaproteobacteria bacterium]|nr:hypothetical protein [Deltaproteobacteria bacterium]